MPFRVIPDLGQRPENSFHPSSKQRCHVLQHNNSWLELSNHANGFKEQSASFAIKSCPCSGVGNILTGEPSTDDIDTPIAFRRESFYIVPTSHVWPVLGENSLAVGVNLDLPLAYHAGSLET
jgi:hypothetical protein